MAKDRQLEESKRVMGALLRMPPKQHDDMKIKKTPPEVDQKKPDRRSRTP